MNLWGTSKVQTDTEIEAQGVTLFSMITQVLYNRTRIQSYNLLHIMLFLKSNCTACPLKKKCGKQTEMTKARTLKTPWESYSFQFSSLPVYTFIYNHVWSIYAIFLRNWVGGMYFNSSALQNESYNIYLKMMSVFLNIILNCAGKNINCSTVIINI